MYFVKLMNMHDGMLGPKLLRLLAMMKTIALAMARNMNPDKATQAG